MVYPADWNEFEDGEGSFLFYNPNEWTGNFRISAYKGSATYGKEAVEQELKENTCYICKDRACVVCVQQGNVRGRRGVLYISSLGYGNGRRCV